MFNDILEDRSAYYNLTMRSKDLAKVISDCYLELGRRSTIALLDRLKEIGFKEAMDGSWKTERTVWGVKEGQNELVKIADFVPEAAKKKVEEVKAGMKAGTFEVFTGPIVTNDGKEVLAKDAKADQAWKDKVDFYVKGVEGKIPKGN